MNSFLAPVANVLGRVKAGLRPFWYALTDVACRALVAIRWYLRKILPRRHHGLPERVVVTLTSYPARYATLALTLKSLLTQSVRPDNVILWIAHDDAHSLPSSVTALRNDGLQIRYCDDLGPYKKLIPALEAFPMATLVSADDDLYYWRDWLAGLIAAHKRSGEIVCHRAHRVAIGPDGSPAPYAHWPANILAHPAAQDIFPTTGGGVLYRAGVFDPRVTQRQEFGVLSPGADDLWFYVMVRLAGYNVEKIGRARPFRPWIGSQTRSLYQANVDPISGNDAKIARLSAAFGWPVSQ